MTVLEAPLQVGGQPATRWNRQTAVWVAYRMLMVERRPVERVAEFLTNISPLIEDPREVRREVRR